MSLEILGLVLLGLLFVVILGGFPISFTLIFLGMVFGYIGLGDRVFYLMTYQVFSAMMDTVLRPWRCSRSWATCSSAGLMRRLFHAVQLMCGRMHGSLYVATIFTATLFAAATGSSEPPSRSSR
jgi:TRAP-type mannitol/chloroaromatic compound transport system permease large subunit